MIRRFIPLRVLPVLLVGGLFLALPAAAQKAIPQPTEPLTLQLDQAIQLALDQSPAIKATAFKAESQANQANAVGRTRWGELSAVASASRFDEDRIMIPMSRQLLAGGLPNAPFDRDQIHYGLTYQIPLYLGGKLSAGIEVAKLEAAKAEALRQGTRWEVRFNVVSLYSGVQTLDGAILASDQLLHTLDTVQQRLQLMVDSGKRPALDLLKVQDQLAEARAQHAHLLAQRTRVKGLLLALMGQSPERTLTVTPLQESQTTCTVAQDSLQRLALASSPVRQAALTQQQSGSGIKAARSGFLPSVVGRANYFGHHADSVADDPTTWELSLGVKLPLFNGASRFAKMSAAKAGQRAATESLKLVRLRRQAELAEALAGRTAAEVGLEAARARVASADEAARSEQIRYDSGASTIEDLLRAQTRQAAANTALAQARGEMKISAEKINSIVELEVIR